MSAGRDAEVLVVGAGPAGAAAARHLAARGIETRLLDARAFPRSKPCGDAVSPGATPLLEELGVLPAVEAAGPALLAGWRVRAQDGTWFGGGFRATDTAAPARGYALPRRELDRILLGAALEAGARFEARHRVFGLERRGSGEMVVAARDPAGRAVRFRARVVIGADGLRSRVARLLGGVRRGARDRLAIVGRFQGGRPPGDHGEMRLGRDGVLGLAPTGGGRCNATLVVPRGRAAEISEDVEAFFRAGLERYGVSDRLADARLAGALEVTGPFEIRPRHVCAPGVLLAGDAAGYFDPFTGQGVHRALETGRLAAAAARRILEAPEREDGALRTYRDALARRLAPSRRLQRLIDAAIVRPRAMAGAARLLRARPDLACLLLDVTGDRLPPSALLDVPRLLRALRGTGPAGGPGAAGGTNGRSRRSGRRRAATRGGRPARGRRGGRQRTATSREARTARGAR